MYAPFDGGTGGGCSWATFCRASAALVTGAQTGRDGTRHEDDMGGFAVGFPGRPDFVFMEESSEEVKALFEADDLGLFEGEGKVEPFEDLSSAVEGVLGLGFGLREDDEIIGIADEFASGGFEFAVEILEEIIGEEG